jgi:autotransporter-associated beta strand protein
MQTHASKPVLARNPYFAFIKQAGLCLVLLFAFVLTSHGALIGYWNFDEASGTTVLDSASTNNGTFAAGVEAPTRVPGRLGGALSFTWQSPGAADPTTSGRRVTMPYNTNFALNNGPFTISYWYRPDLPFPAGRFPGIMRLGDSQSATTGGNVGWGFFRQNNMVYKRGNSQPGAFPNMLLNQWNHIALQFSGNTNSSGVTNNVAFMNGTMVGFFTTLGWTNVTTTRFFELGRMDGFDHATLDELALWNNEAISPAKIRSIYTVPTSLSLDYNLADMQVLWSTFDAGAGTTNVVKGNRWSYTATVPGSTAIGNAYISGGTMYLVLATNGSGVLAPLTFIGGTFSPGGIGTITSLALNDTLTLSNANLIWDINTNTNDLLNITGDINIANSILSIDPFTTLTPGTYRLINYTGNRTGSLTVSNTTRYTLTIDDSTAGQIDLIVAGAPGSVIWNSTSSGAWDLSSLNWSNTTTSTTDRFFQGDAVRFDDSGAFQTNITVSTPVFPNSITVDSSTRPYIFAGAEQIGGVGNGITKNGTSALVLNTPNTFVGDVQVNAGTLRLGNSSALGTTNGQTFIANGATLDLGGVNPGTESVTVQGAGVGGVGAVINTGGAINNNGLRGRVVLLGDTTFGGTARWDIFNAQVTGNGFNVTKIGNIEMYLNGNGNMGFGDVNVQAGFFTWGGNSTPGDPTRPYTVSSGATLNFFSHTVPFDKVLVLQGGANVQNGSGNPNLAGPVTLNGAVNFNLANPLLVSNVISGAGSIVKLGANALNLFGTNTYTGVTTISAGRINLLANASIATSSRISVLTGTTFDVSRVAGAYPLGNGQTLAGVGTIAGSVGVPTGAIVVPGTDNVPGTLTVTNALALSGGTLVFDIAAATTEGAGVNDLINVGGNLDLTGVSSIRVNPLGILAVNNTYTLINYTGTLSGTVSELTVANDSRYTFSLSLTNPGKLTLHVTGGAAAELYWYGGTPGAENLWDVMTSPNWSDTLGNPELFFGGDIVIFNDFASTNVVELVGSLTPASIRIENGDPAFPYTFTGSGKLSGNSSLTKTFAEKTTIANTGVNDYVGPTDIQEGTLQVGTGGAFGNLGSGPITNNATLIFNRSDTLTLANVLAGSGSLIKSNANLLVLPTNNSNYNGTITAIGGTVRPGITNALGNGTGGTVIAPGATLDINAINLGAESVTVAGTGVNGTGAVVNASATGQNNALRFVTLSGNTTVGGVGRWDIRADPTASLSTGGNGYSLTKIGANQVSLVDVTVDPALGDINVNAGTLSAELGSGAGNPTNTITLANNAVLQFFNRSTVWDKIHVLNGGQNIFNNSGASTMNGPVTLNALVTFNVAGTSLTVNSPIGGSGALTKSGGSPLILLSDCTYPGATTVSAGSLQLGVGTNGGWVAGSIVMGANTLTVYRSDTVVVSNTLTGTGTLNVRTPNGLVLSNGPINFGTINVGLTTPGRLVLEPGFTGNIGSLSAGDSPGSAYGEVFQNGGTLNVSALCRIGHWPTETSTYRMGGGTLNVTATPSGTVNLGGQPEQNGVIYLGVDGTGILVQTGGVIRAHGLVFDGRGFRTDAGTHTFILNGGQCILGLSGMTSGNLNGNTNYAIRLGGGTLGSSANWTSVLNITLTGTNGDVTVDTAAFTNTLNGALSGPGGLVKIGAGTLRLNGTNTFAGTLTVSNGTLDGNGVISGPVVVQSGGTLSPGTSIGALRMNTSVTLGGNTLIEINKTGSVLTNDRILNATNITYGGTLTVVASGDALAAGDSFAIFGSASYTGSFSSTSLPVLPAPLQWDLSQLAVNGTITVVTARARIFSPTLSGNTLTLAGTGGYPGAAYRVLRSADIAAPLASWSTVTTGNFDVNGNFSVNITIDTADPQFFYAIVSP